MSLTTPVVLERDNVNDESVTLSCWFANHGDKIELNALLAEVETSKANIEVYSPAAGYLVWEFPQGATVPVSSRIGHISEEAPTGPPQFTSNPVNRQQQVTPQEVNRTQNASLSGPAAPAGAARAPNHEWEFPSASAYRQRFSPLAAKMMEAHGLTAHDFAGKSAVRKRDVIDLLNPTALEPGPAKSFETVAAATKVTQPHKRVPLTRLKHRERSTLAAGVGNAIQSAVSVMCFTRGLRSILAANTSLGASAVIVYEVSRLLRKFPALNSTYHDGAMLQYEQVNLGYAMDDGRGLKVAVLQDCDSLSLPQIATELRNLTLAYVENKLTPGQLANATFTVSDLSNFGVSSFYPLISENQGGILGVGGEQFAPDSVYGFYSLTLTFDHQLSDGRTAALFLADLKERLGTYEEMIHTAREEVACSQCGRSVGQLIVSHEHLLRSVVPQGYLCTLCAAGY